LLSGISINLDSTCFFHTRSAAEMTEAGVDAFCRAYAGAHVRELLFNVNAQRTAYASQVWEPRWEGSPPGDGPTAANMRLLHDRGIDPYARWLRGARALGISPWISMRMGDNHHHHDPSAPGHSTLWRTRPDLRRVTYRAAAQGGDRALDYAQPEVYAWHLALVRELVERYDMDGLELDWSRHFWFLRPGREIADAPVLTRFVAEAREITRAAAARWGHPLRLGVRVPATPRTSRWLGLDAVQWAREGLIDYLVPTPRWYTIDFALPLDEWREWLAGAPVLLGAGIERHVRPYPHGPREQPADGETLRGAAATLLHAGADRIYLFNYFDRYSNSLRTPLIGADSALLSTLGDEQTLIDLPRRHLVTYQDVRAPGEPDAAALPLAVSSRYSDEPRLGQVRVNCGPLPTGGSAVLALAFSAEQPAPPDGLQVFVNGVAAPALGAIALPKPCPASPAYGYGLTLAKLHAGYNLVEVLSPSDCTIGWVEIRFGGC
jgi:hypothetical protein